MPFDPRRVKALFQSAIDLPDPAERPAFLDRECGGDPELRRRLDELLSAHEQPASALGRPLAANPDAETDADETAASGSPIVEGDATISRSDATISYRERDTSATIDGVIAGRYKLRQKIGEGGMGTVFLAEQIQPVKRQVALKLIKAGMDSHAVLTRFESERQALALMDHPNIAKVLDAGTTEHGRPFFVMELVKGIPLTEYCDRHRLGLAERLNLVRQICSAVQHAHQKGIIHRDLKPTNILVESHDDRPVPKVIDFGLAKATGGRQLTENSLYSAFGAVAGTPLYMAPEQTTFNAIDVDTRADIYALGVILYELLTGSTPIQRETFKKAAIDEMLRMVREDEPPKPSNRISSSEALPSIAANRHIEPARLSRFVRGDLDWIVMKALAKERQRRYESAIALANDIERFITHEPVSAGPPTASYRFRKFVRRNRGQVLAAAAVLAVLMVGIVGTTLGLVEADRQRGLAVERRKDAEKRLKQRDEANQILLSIFKDLDHKGNEADGRPLAARLGERLEQAAAQLDGDAIDDPLGTARMQVALGQALIDLSYHDKAIDLLGKALDTLSRKLGRDHPDTIEAISSLAEGLQDAGRFDRALPLREEALAWQKSHRGPDHRDTLKALADMAFCYQESGDPVRAMPLQEKALERRKAMLGPDDLDTLTSLDLVATAYVANGQANRALPLFEQALAGRKAKLPPDNPDTVASLNNLAGAHHALGQLDRAVPLMEEALRRLKSIHSLDHRLTLRTMNNLAMLYSQSGAVERALPLFEEALERRGRALAPDDLDTLQSMDCLASCLLTTGDLQRAVLLAEGALKGRRAKLPPDHPDTIASMNNVASAYSVVGRVEEAMPLMEEVLAIFRIKFTSNHPNTITVIGNLALLCASAGKFDRAETLLREQVALTKSQVGNPAPYAGALATLGSVLLQRKSWPEAEAALRESLAIREGLTPDAWTTFNTRSLLGEALLWQNKTTDAGPLLRSGYEGMKQRSDKIPAPARVRIGQALDRLIALAKITNKPEELKAWREERAKLPADSIPKPEPKKP